MTVPTIQYGYTVLRTPRGRRWCFDQKLPVDDRGRPYGVAMGCLPRYWAGLLNLDRYSTAPRIWRNTTTIISITNAGQNKGGNLAGTSDILEGVYSVCVSLYHHHPHLYSSIRSIILVIRHYCNPSPLSSPCRWKIYLNFCWQFYHATVNGHAEWKCRAWQHSSWSSLWFVISHRLVQFRSVAY